MAGGVRGEFRPNRRNNIRPGRDTRLNIDRQRRWACCPGAAGSSICDGAVVDQLHGGTKVIRRARLGCKNEVVVGEFRLDRVLDMGCVDPACGEFLWRVDNADAGQVDVGGEFGREWDPRGVIGMGTVDPGDNRYGSCFTGNDADHQSIICESDGSLVSDEICVMFQYDGDVVGVGGRRGGCDDEVIV